FLPSFFFAPASSKKKRVKILCTLTVIVHFVDNQHLPLHKGGYRIPPYLRLWCKFANVGSFGELSAPPVTYTYWGVQANGFASGYAFFRLRLNSAF
ncbi:MAG: hypothetical protein ACI3XO_05980, partial [Eubacteriales bacterium]